MLDKDKNATKSAQGADDAQQHKMHNNGKGKRYDDEIKAQAVQLYMQGASQQYIADTLNVGRTTMIKWLYDVQRGEDDIIAKARMQAANTWISRASKTIDALTSLIERQATVACANQAELDEALEILKDQAQTATARQMAANKIGKIANPNMRDVAIALGTMYDKRALANGDATSRIETQQLDMSEEELRSIYEDMRQEAKLRLVK